MPTKLSFRRRPESLDYGAYRDCFQRGLHRSGLRRNDTNFAQLLSVFIIHCQLSIVNYFKGKANPETMSQALFADLAIYWFIHPCNEVNARCASEAP